MRIALIGLDGSGKSANVSIIKGRLKNYKFLWVRWKPTLLKPLYKALNRKVASTQSNEKASLDIEYKKKASMKRKIFKNPVVRKLWFFIAFIDYLVQFHLKTIKYILKKTNIIFDRCYLDFFIDQGISMGESVEKICKKIRAYRGFFPKLDKYIYIKVSPEICFSRKNDIPNMEYLEKRYKIYEQLCRNSNWITVNGEEELDIVSSKVMSLIEHAK